MRILLIIAGMICSVSLTAEPLPVSAVRVMESAGFKVERFYGGQLRHHRISVLGFEFGGVVEEISFREGERVSKGQRLMSQASDSLSAQHRQADARVRTTAARVRMAVAQLDLARVSLKRYEELVAGGHGSAQQLDELRAQFGIDEANVEVMSAELSSAEATRNLVSVDLDKTVVRAPYDGILQTRYLDEGSIVSPGQPVLRLMEDAYLEARVGIPVQQLGNLKVNEVYEFLINGDRVNGIHNGVLPEADLNTGTVTALFTIGDPNRLAGHLVELVMTAEIPEPGFWVPVSALAESQRGLWSVMVVREMDNRQAQVEARLVEILHRGKDRVFVRGILNDGELIVSGGTDRVVSGQKVRVARVVEQLTGREPS